MTGRWLSIVGIGEDGLSGLGARARSAIDRAEVLIGGRRHLEMVPDDGRERLPWPSPFDALAARIEAMRGRRVCVLATGDPMHFGVGAVLARHFSPTDLDVLPAPSSFSLACARLAWPAEDVAMLSVHGRPLEHVIKWFSPGARLLVLAHDRDTPARLATRLVEHDLADSRLLALERLGGPRERIVEHTAGTWGERQVASLHVIAIECAAGDVRRLSRTPGLPDDEYRHDGQLTKQMVRAATLAALAPAPGLHLWDVGAGAGSIAIEWLRAAPGASATAVERSAERAARIRDNAARLGTPELAVVEGEAPAALAGLAAPQAVFLGGGLASTAIFDRAWDALETGGRLVANAVTLEGTRAIEARHAELGGELARIDTARARPVGAQHAYRPAMTVTQLALTRS